MFPRMNLSYLEEEGVGCLRHLWENACASSHGAEEPLNGLKEGNKNSRFALLSNRLTTVCRNHLMGIRLKPRRTGGNENGLLPVCVISVRNHESLT